MSDAGTGNELRAEMERLMSEADILPQDARVATAAVLPLIEGAITEAEERGRLEAMRYGYSEGYSAAKEGKQYRPPPARAAGGPK